MADPELRDGEDKLLGQVKIFYRDAGVLNGENALELPDHCADAATCWEGLGERRYGSCTIALPWIGPKYEEARVLVVAENLNSGSDLWALAGGKGKGYVLDAMCELEVRPRVRFGNAPKDYAGTLLWHCIGTYAAVILRELGVPPFAEMQLTNGEVPVKAITIDAYRYLAYLNHVKCSPNDGARSQPSLAMWNRCGKRFLAGEINILEPAVILALGSGNNGPRLAAILRSRWTHVTSRRGNYVTLHRFFREGEHLDLVVVPHPSYFRVSWKTVVSGLVDCLHHDPDDRAYPER
ncbi:MAG TPA: uracil-DNA glycosylase family protein [Polyangia bacterium]|nr:uracil-DNA glycosylase family protein [Polyangia bacterium]